MRSVLFHLLLGVALTAPAVAMDSASKKKKQTEEDRRDGPYLGVSPGARDTAPGKTKIRSRGATLWPPMRLLPNSRVLSIAHVPSPSGISFFGPLKRDI